MTFSLSFPTDDPSSPMTLTVAIGEMLFILGANGTGKSSIMQDFSSAHSESARRIAAHRQNWFRSGAPEFTAKQRVEHGKELVNYDRHATSRWMDDYATQRAMMAIYDLVNAENVRARNIARAVDAKEEAEVQSLSAKDSVFTTLNRLLRLANLDIAISIEANDEIVAMRGASKPYSISKLSDGERNALLIAANVLTAPSGTLLLIDEPERHMHRSIISPLLSLLFREKTDCAFVISTHEPLLPADNPESKVLLTRGCTYDNDRVSHYQMDLLENTTQIDEELRRTILGERRNIVFVEGSENSPDKALYSLLFPNKSIVPKTNCREVENAVSGIKGAAELHWVKPFGLVDNDTSDPSRISDLRSKDVFALNVYSVESIYYHPDVQRLAASSLMEVVGGNLEEKLDKAKHDAINAIRRSADHLALQIALKAARFEVFSLLPKKSDMQAGGTRTLELDMTRYLNTESSRLNDLINSSDFVGILQRYPIRESGSLEAISKALSFQSRAQYEATVRNCIARDPQALQAVRMLLGDFPTELFA